MEKGGGGGEDLSTRAAGGMCDRFLTFLAKNLTMSRTTKSISDGPKNNGDGGGGHPPAEVGDKEDREEDDEFAIPIERAEFDDYEFGGGHGEGGSYGTVPTILGESTAASTTTTRDVPDEAKTGAPADNGAEAEGPAPAVEAAVEETTKVRKSVTIKEDQPEQEGGGSATKTVERKRSSLFKKRQASSSAAGDEQQRAPRRSGLRPRMPPALRVPSNINERSSTYIEERRKSFGRGGKPAPDK